jgi:hypothetical protein
MNAGLRLLYEHVPSFKREHGGLYRLYAAAASRIYAACMVARHKRGKHQRRPHGLDPRCQWCGEDAGR